MGWEPLRLEMPSVIVTDEKKACRLAMITATTTEYDPFRDFIGKMATTMAIIDWLFFNWCY